MKEIRAHNIILKAKESGVLSEYLTYLQNVKRLSLNTSYGYYMMTRDLAKFLSHERHNMDCHPSEVVLSNVSTEDMQSITEDEWNSYLEQRKTAQEQIKEYKEAVKQKKKFGDEMDKKISTDFTVSSTSATVNETIRTTKGKTFIYSVSYDKDGNKTEEKIDEYKTMGAKMAKAGVNTILSMAIVFAVLIFISLIIACFKVIGWIQNRKNAKQVDKAKAQLASVETAPQPVEENLVDDLELVAVITAAIAASENASADGLVVRSIIRR